MRSCNLLLRCETVAAAGTACTLDNFLADFYHFPSEFCQDSWQKQILWKLFPAHSSVSSCWLTWQSTSSQDTHTFSIWRDKKTEASTKDEPTAFWMRWPWERLSGVHILSRGCWCWQLNYQQRLAVQPRSAHFYKPQRKFTTWVQLELELSGFGAPGSTKAPKPPPPPPNVCHSLSVRCWAKHFQIWKGD